MSKKIMIQGTASGVGKSMVTTAICRVLYSDGHRVAPFKPQNMASKSYITADGSEIGIGQAVQARACNKVPTADMNPILLKPLGNYKTQLFVQGKLVGDSDNKKLKENKNTLKSKVMESFQRLAEQNDFMVLEGAGSSAEINMMDDDISNMGTAEAIDAPVILVADIDRGGVFASIYGTIMLQKPENKDRIKGVIINKFRGKMEFLESGIREIEKLTGVPVLGVLPYENIYLDEEDSLVEMKPVMEEKMGNSYIDKKTQEEKEFDKLEKMFRENIDMKEIYKLFR